MKTFLLISPKNRTTYNFRGDLIKDIIKNDYIVYATGPTLEDVDEIEKLGAKFIHIPLKKNGTSIIGDLKYCLSLYKVIKHVKPDVVLSYTIKPVVFGSIAARFAGVKNINSMITGLGYTFISKSLKAKILNNIVTKLYKTALGYSKKVIFQNEDDLKDFINLKLVNKEKCFIVNGSGVNMDKYSKTSFPDNITFFMLSRIMKSKGVIEYLEACKIVKERYPEIKCMLLGAIENIQDTISKDTIDLYINDNIITYYPESPNIIEFYKKTSVYVLPSYREGTPRTVLEAMACGKPIITTNAPGCRETVIDGKTGFLVQTQDVKMIADKMISFIENPDKIKEMGDNSYKYCKEKFEVTKVNLDMLKIMEIKSI